MSHTKESVMEQVQIFASAWSLVGSPFDNGDALDNAHTEKADLSTMVGDVIHQRDEALARCVRLERELDRANGFHERLAEQRDELLAVLKSMFNEHGEFEYELGTLIKARAAIAKAKVTP